MRVRQGEEGSLCMKVHEAQCTHVRVHVECVCSYMMWVLASAPHLSPCAFLCVSACEFYMRVERLCTCHKKRNVPGIVRGTCVCPQQCVMHVPVSWCPPPFIDQPLLPQAEEPQNKCVGRD